MRAPSSPTRSTTTDSPAPAAAAVGRRFGARRILLDRRAVPRGLRRRSCSASRCCSTCKTLQRRRAVRVRHRGGALLRVRPRHLLVDPARPAAAAAAGAALGAARRRRPLHRPDDDRQRRHRRPAADPAVPAARGERLAAAHAHGVLPCGARDRRRCSGSTSAACSRGRSRGAQPFQTGLIGFGYFATVGIARRARQLRQGVRGARRAARHRRRQPRAGEPPDHPGHAGRRAGGRPERRRAQPQRAGHAAARRLRPDARRHAPRRVLARRCTTTGGAGSDDRAGAAAAAQGRGDAAAAARAPGADRLRASTAAR